MKYLLDICTISDFIKGQPNVVQHLKATSPSRIFISSITRMEVEYGLALHAERARQLAPVLQALLSSITTLPFDEADAQAAASVRTALQKKGKQMGAYDVLIAGCGLAKGLALVTSNVAEFRRVSGLQVENWR
jgi:tRNA(fMet)-specific endonuclease VapC